MTIFAAIALGVVLAWASVFAILPLQRAGVPENLATNVPFAAFSLGATWGLALRFSERARTILLALSAPFILGLVFGFFAMLAGAVLVGFGVPSTVAEHVPRAGFALGFALGLAPLGLFVVTWIRGLISKSE